MPALGGRRSLRSHKAAQSMYIVQRYACIAKCAIHDAHHITSMVVQVISVGELLVSRAS